MEENNERPVPRQVDIYMMLLRSMDSDTARVLSQKMEAFVAQDVLGCADVEYNEDDVRLAIGRYFRDKLGLDD